MAKLMKLNLFLFFRWKVILLLGGYIFLLAIARVILLQFASVEVGANSWDLLIHSQGGLKVDPELPLWQYPGWVSSLAPLFFLVYQLASFTTGYDTFLLTRSGSRARRWYAKLVAVVIVSILYSIGYGLIHFLVGLPFFGVTDGWSAYYPLVFPELAQHSMDPWQLLLMIQLNFILGTISLSLGILTVALLLKNSVHAYVIGAVLFFVAGGIYFKGLISKPWALFFYPSFIDSFQVEGSAISIFMELLVLNLGIICFILLLHLYVIRKYNLVIYGQLD